LSSLIGQLFPAPLQISSCTPSLSEKTVLPPLKNDFWIILSEIFSERLFQTFFMNYGFINLEIKKMCYSKMIFFSFEFSIPKISLAYGTTILETPKTVKGSFCIFEDCRGA